MPSPTSAAVHIRLETPDMTYPGGKTVGDGDIFVAHIARCGKTKPIIRAVGDGGITITDAYYAAVSNGSFFVGHRSHSLHCGLQIWRRLRRLEMEIETGLSRQPAISIVKDPCRGSFALTVKRVNGKGQLSGRSVRGLRPASAGTLLTMYWREDDPGRKER